MYFDDLWFHTTVKNRTEWFVEERRVKICLARCMLGSGIRSLLNNQKDLNVQWNLEFQSVKIPCVGYPLSYSDRTLFAFECWEMVLISLSRKTQGQVGSAHSART